MSEIKDDAYRRAFDEAIAEFRALVDEFSKKQRRFVALRCAIVVLAQQIGAEVPADVLASADKRTVAVRNAMLRARETT